jgi:MFS family permease
VSSDKQSPPADGINRAGLFVVSVVALTTAGIVFAVRGTCMEDLGKQFALSNEVTGGAIGAAFLSFAIAVFIGSPLCDYVGMRALLAIASILHIAGTTLTILTPQLQGTLSPAMSVMIGMFTVGLAHGLVEAVINPLTATLYPDDKTHRLNVLHAWWPGGLIIGGLIGLALREAGMGWQVRLGVILLPAAVYGLLLIPLKFPPTERVSAGVSGAQMLREAFQPLFLVLVACMFLTAAMELGPGQWVDGMLKNVGMPGIVVLVYVSLLMFIFRHFAGTFAHKLSPIGLMWCSSLVAGIGLLALSLANNVVTALVASTIWGAGVCFMWPTMLGITSERFPRAGALAMGIIGSAGNLSIFFVLPAMGKIYDNFTQKALPAGEMLESLRDKIAGGNTSAQGMIDAAQKIASPMAFRYVAALGIVLVVVFGLMWLRDKAAGGYKAVKITGDTVGVTEIDEEEAV